MSTQKTTIQIFLDEELIKEAENIFQKLGLGVESAIQLFLEQAVWDQAIPFEILKGDK
ncbi:type II toxin-antitoxin system RelB/DinJ family antitoxin [Enterococcus sp. CWB-B31]|uniref:type II toxin-antitoxin system RelB/DinJ family antitoxin n=1 Tax=Enterococcus sp. CWB-B31 TaxID=2885159 RepID=UPI001E5814A9|nr:type II toxin-antitoxin system RelB/DinJ family antitoxin [Enterococcus sp. CWB-B31]MCB5953978.1 type II toxin-antitoxin system RelB/DinJ family antitoxin [Enterococcus sp. CWB-B31]